MSASQMERLACSHAQIIPSKRVLLTDPSQLPDVYSSTPGGTLYSTTPGGTKIIYERSFLMNLKNSPLGRTPPKNCIPSGLVRGNPHSPVQNTKTSISRSPPKSVHHQQQQQKKQPPQDDHEQLFDMDI